MMLATRPSHVSGVENVVCLEVYQQSLSARSLWLGLTKPTSTWTVAISNDKVGQTRRHSTRWNGTGQEDKETESDVDYRPAIIQSMESQQGGKDHSECGKTVWDRTGRGGRRKHRSYHTISYISGTLWEGERGKGMDRGLFF
jgi:hypothetical protein